MRYSEFNEDQNEDRIRSLLEEYFAIIGLISIENGYVNVDDKGNQCAVKLRKNCNKLPVKFNRVSGRFSCSRSALTSLEGCPKTVGLNFNCSHNVLKSLVGGPDVVGLNYFCNESHLISLEGCPTFVGKDFSSHNNNLTSLKGISDNISKIFLDINPLTSLEGLTKNIKIISLDWHKDLPLLRLLQCHKANMFDNDTVSDIINKYCVLGFSRSNLLACQRELIDAGYESNARW